MQSLGINIRNKRLHYLVDGSGPPIMLFHASPMSSKSLLPLILLLKENYTVIAPDTPGYGFSDSPSRRPENIIDYVHGFDSLRKELGIETMAIYGTATGAQIAIRYGLAYPEIVQHIFLDNTAHFTLEEKEKIFEHYFPDLSPVEDGSHLTSVWDIADNLFRYFPWCFREEKYKLRTPVPPLQVMHMVALEYLKAGANYDWAYRAAFKHEDRKYIADLTVPTLIFRWELSILGAYTDRIFEIDLPSNISWKIIKRSQDRYKTIAQTTKELFRGEDYVLTPVGSILPNQELPILDRPFPKPEPSGKYLLKGWSWLKDHVEKGTSMDQLTQIFIKWASA